MAGEDISPQPPEDVARDVLLSTLLGESTPVLYPPELVDIARERLVLIGSVVTGVPELSDEVLLKLASRVLGEEDAGIFGSKNVSRPTGVQEGEVWTPIRTELYDAFPTPQSREDPTNYGVESAADPDNSGPKPIDPIPGEGGISSGGQNELFTPF